jgi:CheY-like chemotaxis protein
MARTDSVGVADGCREVVGLLEEAIASSRTLTGELSPPILQTGGLVAGLEWLVRWKAEKYQLAVELQADPRVAPDSEAMALLLFQSVRELLFNVVKHAQVREARVEVRQQDGHLQIIVSDQGVGFDPATLPTAGTGGLGLSSIRQRLEYLGGCVGIASAPGEGCRITLAAPLQRRASVAAAPLVSPEAGQPRRRLGRGAKIRVLVVDDHAVVRHALAQMLDAEADLEVVGEAADGKAGVARTREVQPDVVLMDINMPVLDGIEATQQLHAEYPGVQVIGLSMFGAVEQTAAMQRAGAVAYVSKTAPAEELLGAIRAAVRRTA